MCIRDRLSCNHVYNQYIFIDDHAENLKNFEQTTRNMQSLSRYSRDNQVNKEWIDEYLNEAPVYRSQQVLTYNAFIQYNSILVVIRCV